MNAFKIFRFSDSFLIWRMDKKRVILVIFKKLIEATLKLICCLLLFLFCVCENPVSTSERLYPDFIDDQINALLVDHLENDTSVYDGVKSFVFFQYYKMVKESDDIFRVMFRMYETSIMIEYQQVFDFFLIYRPHLYVADIRKVGSTYSIEKMVSAPLFILTADTLKALFPDEVYEKVISNERDSYYDNNRTFIGKRITDYCKKTLTDDRFIYIDPPRNRVDSHMHTPDVYTLLNLKACYEYTSITEIKDTIVDSLPIQIMNLTSSPDGRYQVFYVSGRSLTVNYEYFYKDNQTGKIFEIKNKATDQLCAFSWNGNGILVFDQCNGRNHFDKSCNSCGVHFEIDVENGKVIWAVPFGTLSFAKSI
jgi:hypothetical protein